MWRQVEDHRNSLLFHTYSQQVWESSCSEGSDRPFQSATNDERHLHPCPGAECHNYSRELPRGRRPGCHTTSLHNSNSPLPKVVWDSILLLRGLKSGGTRGEATRQHEFPGRYRNSSSEPVPIITADDDYLPNISRTTHGQYFTR